MKRPLKYYVVKSVYRESTMAKKKIVKVGSDKIVSLFEEKGVKLLEDHLQHDTPLKCSKEKALVDQYIKYRFGKRVGIVSMYEAWVDFTGLRSKVPLIVDINKMNRLLRSLDSIKVKKKK